MGGKKGGENTKKVAGNAKKAEAASRKQAEVESQVAAAEDSKWARGSKDEAKKAEAAAKKAEAAKAKAERDRLLAEEEATQKATPKGANKKTAERKTRGTLDLGQLDDERPVQPFQAQPLNASGIDDALDALSLASGNAKNIKLERHPERRFKASFEVFQERRMPEIRQEYPGLRKNQYVEKLRKEFETSVENPFNQVGNIRYDATKEDLVAEKERIQDGLENRYADD